MIKIVDSDFIKKRLLYDLLARLSTSTQKYVDIWLSNLYELFGHHIAKP